MGESQPAGAVGGIPAGGPAGIPSLEATEPVVPPGWALWERRLIEVMNRAGPAYVARYTRPDGTLIWRDAWPGMDGSDDVYEAFHTFPLFYALGGSAEIDRLGRRQWDAMTWQFTEYGQIYREFDAYYDWMHHGESSLYFYYLGLADPYDLKDRQRAARFAGFYTGEDDEARNYDPVRRLIRSPINGSRGPRFELTAEDWSTHRFVLSHLLPPFEDIPGVSGPEADWNDDATFAAILHLMNRRMARGDVPLNLTATSLVTHAYLYTGEAKYKGWVLDYLDAWRRRTADNGGIIPDNVGLSGRIGECMDGKWWGGYYGWRWPHGALTVLEPVAVAGMNALLLSGDQGHLDLIRSQLDLLWSLRREHDGRPRVPHRHLDAGWSDFRPMSPALAIQVWSVSQAAEDLERVVRLPDRERWDGEFAVRGTGWAPGARWFRYLRGELPDYPETTLQASYREVWGALQAIREEARDPQSWYIQHWIPRNPVVPDGLLQLTTGAPPPIYHGGLLHCRVRYFDPQRGRPGLPDDVAALVEQVHPAGFRLRLVNLDPQAARTVIAQAGAFGEHEFAAVRVLEGGGAGEPRAVASRWLQVVLHPGAGVTLDLTTRRYVHTPTYELPWGRAGRDVTPIRRRTPAVDPGALRFDDEAQPRRPSPRWTSWP
jgi:hypothetical protein